MSEPLSLLNVFEVGQDDGTVRHLVGFVEPVRAGAEGIAERSIVGEIETGPTGEFDPGTFRPNPAFVAAFVEYMDAEAARSPEVVAEALRHPGGRLELIDPRRRGVDEGDVPAADVVGSFEVDDAGGIVPGSFLYNPDHAWFDPAGVPSGVLADRRFYDWLNPPPGRD